MMARKVKDSISPLARDSPSFGTSSGITPYFAGANSALWHPIRKTTRYRAGSRCRAKEITARKVAATSKSFTATISRDFASRSARLPAGADRIRKGSTKAVPTPAVTVPASAAPWLPIRKKMIKSFSMLSFKAPRNWVALSQASGFELCLYVVMSYLMLISLPQPVAKAVAIALPRNTGPAVRLPTKHCRTANVPPFAKGGQGGVASQPSLLQGLCQSNF